LKREHGNAGVFRHEKHPHCRVLFSKIWGNLCTPHMPLVLILKIYVDNPLD